MNEGKKDRRDPIRTVKPRNFVAKNAGTTTSGAGAHKDKKKATTQVRGVKHKKKEYAEHLDSLLSKALTETSGFCRVCGCSPCNCTHIISENEQQYNKFRVGQKVMFKSSNGQEFPSVVVAVDFDDEAVKIRSMAGKPFPNAGGDIETIVDPGWKFLTPMMRVDPNSLARGSSHAEEGWGAERQQRELDASNAKWREMLAKYQDDPEMTEYLKMFRVSNWGPDKSEAEAKKWIAQGKPLPQWYQDIKAGKKVQGYKLGEGEGDPEGLPELTVELAKHIRDQIGTEGPHAICKSVTWGDGAAKDLVLLIQNALDEFIGEDDVNEVSKATLGSYIKKASGDLADRVSGSSFKSGKAGDAYNKADPSRQEKNRERGISRAVDKLTKEGWTHDTLAARLFETENTYEDKLNNLLSKKLKKQ